MWTILISLLTNFNFKSIFDFFIKNWKIVSIILIIMGSFFYVKSLNNQIKELNAEVVELKTINAYCENSKATLENSLKTQNYEIDKWVKIGKNSKKEFDTLKDNIDKQRKLSNLELQKILKEKIPENCQDAINYMVDGVKDIQWTK